MYDTVQYIFVLTVGAYSLYMSVLFLYFQIVFYCTTIAPYSAYFFLFGKPLYCTDCTYMVMLLPVVLLHIVENDLRRREAMFRERERERERETSYYLRHFYRERN